MAEKRKAIPKGTRFEVFKRDCFTCQYCGAKAPDAILEVDHIMPVAKGGTNDILNLITSCRDCNRGKSKKELSDKAVVAKQIKQLEDIQIRREMIEMMSEWRKELMYELELDVDCIEAIFQQYYPEYDLTDYGRSRVRSMIKEFGIKEVSKATEIALNYYNSFELAFEKIGGICYNRKINRKAD